MKLRYFCDQCGTEVPRNTVRCPACGRYFTAIQCPRCHFQGEEEDFAAGCPRCGYMRVPMTRSGGGPQREEQRGARVSRRGRRPPPPDVRAPRPSPETLAPVSPRLLRIVGLLLTAALIALVVALFLI